MNEHHRCFYPEGASRHRSAAMTSGSRAADLKHLALPTLVIHGDADKLVPIYQAEVFGKRCLEVGAPFKLIVRPGKDHGWSGMEEDIKVFAEWFDEHLLGKKPSKP